MKSIMTDVDLSVVAWVHKCMIVTASQNRPTAHQFFSYQHALDKSVSIYIKQ